MKGRKGCGTFFVLTAVLLGTFFSASPSRTVAAEAAEENIYTAPVDTKDVLKEKMNEDVENAVKQAVDQKPVADRGYLLEGVMSNTWLVTRSVVNGFGDIQETISYLGSEEVQRTVLISDILTQKSFAGEMLQGGRKDAEEERAKQLERAKTEPITEGMKKNSPRLQAQMKFVENLSKLDSVGFFGGGGANSMMKKCMFIGYFILGIALMARLASIGFDSIVKDPQPPLAWFRVFFKYMILLLAIMFLRNLAMFGISMSDAVRNAVVNTAFGDVSQAGDVVGKLLRAKVDLLRISPEVSLWEVMKSGVSELLAQFFGWLGYFLAAAILFVINLLADIMMSMTLAIGPLIIAMSLLPTFDDTLGHWFKGYVTLLFYGPLSAVFSVLLVAMLVIGLDSSPVAFIIVCIAFIAGAANVPDMAKNLSGAVLAGLAVGLASLPMRFAGGALTGGLSSTLGALSSKVKGGGA